MGQARAAFAFLAVLAWGVASAGSAAVRMDVLHGVWRDDFTDLTGLALNQQGTMAAPSGFTVDPKLQTMTWPTSATILSEPFTATGSSIDRTLMVGNAGSSAEYLTLYNVRYDPGGQWQYPSECVDWAGETCGGEWNHCLSGVRSADNLRNVPLNEGSWLPMAGWDAAIDPDVPCPALGGRLIDYIYCRRPLNLADGTPNPPNMSLFAGQPLLSGISLAGLVPNRGYTAAFTAGAFLMAHIAHTGTQYLRFEVWDDTAKTGVASQTLYEGQFFSNSLPAATVAGPPGPNGVGFDSITTVSVHLDPASNLPGHAWDFRVHGLVDKRTAGTDWGCTHCTMVGPVWLTADEGTFVSSVFDSLSNGTRWDSICWVADMGTGYVDSPISPLAKGVPLTPVRLSYAVSNAKAATLPVTFTVTHGGEATAGVIGMNMVDNSCNPIHDAADAAVTGRYFQWSAQLLGRFASASLDADLAPGPGALWFGALRPILRRVAARYYVCAARAQSKRIAPTSVKRWLAVDYVAEKPSPGATVRVDVLGADGSFLIADVAPGTSLAGLSPYRYPSLVLRATIESDPADCAKRPIVKAWQVTWEPQPDILDLTCNSIRPALGEECLMQIRMDVGGRALVEVHDAAGQAVKVLLRGDLPAEAHTVSWDGRNRVGDLVAAGVYYVVAEVPGHRRVKKLAVIR